jgi:hypothetical protein
MRDSIISLVSFVLAVLSLLFETLKRDSVGNKIPSRFGTYKLTPAGRMFLGLLAFSSGLGMWLQARSSNAARDEREHLQSEILRLQSPFSRDVKLSATIAVPGKAVPAYISRIHKETGSKVVVRIKNDLRPHCNEPSEEMACAFWVLSLYVHFLSWENSSQPQEFRDVVALTHNSAISLALRDMQPDDDVSAYDVGEYLKGCLEGKECRSLDYMALTDSLEFSALNLSPTFQRDNGTFTSLLDFPGSSVIVELNRPHGIPYEIRSLKLTTPTGRTLEIGTFHELQISCPGGPCPYGYFAAKLEKSATWK